MKKVLSIILFLSLVISLFSVTSAAQTPESLNELIQSYRSMELSEEACRSINELIHFYQNNPTFHEYLNQYPDEAFAMAQRQLASAAQPSTRAIEGNYYYCPDVAAINQTYTNWCGAASILMSLKSIKRDSAVSGSTQAAKLKTIAQNDLGLATSGEGAIVWKIQSTMNKYMLSDKKKYAFLEISSLATMRAKIRYSLLNDMPVIVNVRASSLPYMPAGWNDGHYVVVEGINEETSEVYLVDPNYNKDYIGKHKISTAQLYKALQDGNRHIIYYEP